MYKSVAYISFMALSGSVFADHNLEPEASPPPKVETLYQVPKIDKNVIAMNVHDHRGEIKHRLKHYLKAISASSGVLDNLGQVKLDEDDYADFAEAQLKNGAYHSWLRGVRYAMAKGIINNSMDNIAVTSTSINSIHLNYSKAPQFIDVSEALLIIAKNENFSDFKYPLEIRGMSPEDIEILKSSKLALKLDRTLSIVGNNVMLNESRKASRSDLDPFLWSANAKEVMGMALDTAKREWCHRFLNQFSKSGRRLLLHYAVELFSKRDKTMLSDITLTPSDLIEFHSKMKSPDTVKMIEKNLNELVKEESYVVTEKVN